MTIASRCTEKREREKREGGGYTPKDEQVKYVYEYSGSYFANLVGTQGSARADNTASVPTPGIFDLTTGGGERVLPLTAFPAKSDFSKFPGKLGASTFAPDNASAALNGVNAKSETEE